MINKTRYIFIVAGVIGFIIVAIISCSDFNPFIAGGIGDNLPGTPEIEVQQGDTDIQINGLFEFGRVIADGINGATSGKVPFSIKNTGDVDLTISEIYLTANVDHFVITDNEPGSIPPSGTKTFFIEFDPIIYGEKTAGVTIENNDPNEKEFTFTITGFGIVIKRMGGSGSDGDFGTSITVGNTSQIIITGSVDGAADLNGDGDQVDGVVETTPIGTYNDIFISCFDPEFNFSWAIRRGGENYSSCSNDIVMDTAGRIIVTGYIIEAFDFNGNGNTSDSYEFSTSTTEDIFILISTDQGNFVKAIRLGGGDPDIGYSVATDSENRIFVTGSITGPADLDGDEETTGPNENPAGVQGGVDIFLCCFDSSLNLQWSKRLGGSDEDRGLAVAIGQGNKVYVTGYVTGDADLDGDGSADPFEVWAGTDVFISCFDANNIGAWLWSARLGGAGNDAGQGIAVDNAGNMVVTGYVDSTADLNGDGDTYDAFESGGYGEADCFISLFDSSEQFRWAKRLGGAFTDAGMDITTDNYNTIIVTGIVTEKADLDGDGNIPGQGPEGFFYGASDVFISSFDSFGNFIYSERIGGSNMDNGTGVAVDKADNIFVCGDVEGDADLNADRLVNYWQELGYGYADIFISTF